EFHKLSGLLFSFTTFIAILSTMLAIVLYPVLKHIAFGFSEEAKHYLKGAYFLLIPYIFSSFYFHHFGAILRSQRRFTSYFIGEFIFSFSSFLFVSIGLFIWKDYKVIAMSISISQILASLYMILASKEFIHFKLYKDSTVSSMIKQFIYLSGVYGAGIVYGVIEKAFASKLGEDAVSALTYGFMVVNIPKNLMKIEKMSITSFSETKDIISKLNFYIKKIFQISIPIAVFMFLASDIIVKLLFGHGAFNQKDIELTSLAVRYFALSLPFLFLWGILYQVFQVVNWLKPIFVVAVFFIFTITVFAYIFITIFKWGIVGICMANFVNYTVGCVVAYMMIRFRLGGRYAKMPRM
ncbi:MAG TPA: murein biosynthesis integral membrane protein MurJ, partial [Hydrogenobaculum sp.]|nr:murein biosynthesis integral membrane protein MurJ [Hydrogenobaculum sp.]